MRMCQSPPGPIWVVGDEAGAKPAVDGHLGLSENPQVVAAVAGAISQAVAALPRRINLSSVAAGAAVTVSKVVVAPLF
jgi:hypothetical protein